MVVVEIDTWDNNEYDKNADADYDHIAILHSGATAHNTSFNLAGPVQASATNPNVEDCQMHLFDILWEPVQQTLSVYFDDEFRLSYTGNIATQFFSGNPLVYWGFTGATGGVSGEQKFCTLSTCNTDCCITQNYAGRDDLFCYNESGYKLSSAFAIYEILWETTGDGIFDNAESINPIYYPGQADIKAGKVNLILRGVGSTSCNDSYDQLELTILQVNTKNIDLNVENVSINTVDEAIVDIGYQVVGLYPLADFVTLQQRPKGTFNWNTVDNLSHSTTTYHNVDMNTSSIAYEYRLSTTTICGDFISSPIHNTILLEYENYTNEGVDLVWNPYVNWPMGVDHYEIWRKLDSDYVLFKVLNTSSNAFSYNNILDGISHSFRILAVAAGSGNSSWSNTIQVIFEKELFFPNVITPNDDGFNDEFTILNVEYYPENNLKIFNRWGRLVFEMNGYSNSWGGEGVSNGVYFYNFSTGDNNNNETSGWVQVMK